MSGTEPDSPTLVTTLLRALKAPAGAVWDALPPYRLVQGALKAKEISPNGGHMILIGSEIVEVDEFTFDQLKVGEPLRARCTRSNRAITIDRLVPGGNGRE